MGKWKPIKTVPRNGSEVLVWVRGDRRPQGHVWVDKFESDWEVAYTDYWKPTHWMPLPEPPK